MAYSLTIFGKITDYQSLLARIHENSRSSVEVSGSPVSWSSATLRGQDSTITFNPIIKVRPGDQFSKLVLGAANYFRRVKTDAVTNQNFIKSFLFDSKIIIGVVAEPELIESAGDFDLIFDLAGICDGLIFNGNAMLDSSGSLLLDDKGAYDKLLG